MGRVFIEHSSKGELVPDEATIQLWAKNIKASTVNGQFDPRMTRLCSTVFREMKIKRRCSTTRWM
jgi:hypothetical protein